MNNTYKEYYVTIEHIETNNQKQFNFYHHGIDNRIELENQVKDWIFPIGAQDGMSEYMIVDSHRHLEYFIPNLNQHETDFIDSILPSFWTIIENLIDGHIDIEQAIEFSKLRYPKKCGEIDE